MSKKIYSWEDVLDGDYKTLKDIVSSVTPRISAILIVLTYRVTDTKGSAIAVSSVQRRPTVGPFPERTSYAT
jgi:hypothetical protein